MNIASLKSGAAAPFAHLFGRATVTKKAQEEENKPGCEEEAEEKKTEEEAEEKKTEAKKSEAKKTDKKDGDGDEKEHDDEEDDDDEEDMEEKHQKKGKKAERARWVTVLQSKAAAGRVESALTMLATTEMEAGQIISVLSTIPAEAKAKSGISERMDKTPIPNVGAGAPASGSAAEVIAKGSAKETAAFMAQVAKKARGEN